MYLQRRNSPDIATIRAYKAQIRLSVDRLISFRKLNNGVLPRIVVERVVAELDRLEVHTHWLMETVNMATKKKYDGTWKGFVDVALTSKEKEDFAAWDVHDEDLWILYQEAIVSGHKFTMSFNKQNETFVAAFTGNEGTADNAGYTLSAFGRSWYDAIRVLLFKHAVLLDGDWSVAKDRTTDTIG